MTSSAALCPRGGNKSHECEGQGRVGAGGGKDVLKKMANNAMAVLGPKDCAEQMYGAG